VEVEGARVEEEGARVEEGTAVEEESDPGVEEAGNGEWSPIEFVSIGLTLTDAAASIVSIFVSVFNIEGLPRGDSPSDGLTWSPPSFAEISGDDMTRGCLATRFWRCSFHECSGFKAG